MRLVLVFKWPRLQLRRVLGVTPSEQESVFCCDTGPGDSPSLLSLLHPVRAGWGYRTAPFVQSWPGEARSGDLAV